LNRFGGGRHLDGSMDVGAAIADCWWQKVSLSLYVVRDDAKRCMFNQDHCSTARIAALLECFLNSLRTRQRGAISHL
jgi:hypothetical protein